MKRFKKFLAILLVASMIFTTNAVSVFAEGVDAGKEEQFNDDMAESTEELSESLELDKEEELAEASEDEELGEEELTEAEADDEFVEEEEEEEAKAEEEELSETGEETEEVLDENNENEEIEKEELKLNEKKEEELYGAGEHKFIIVGKNSSGETMHYSVDDTVDEGTWGQGYNAKQFSYEGKRGWYIIAQETSLDEDDVKNAWNENSATGGNWEFVTGKWAEWHANPTYDIAIGFCYGDEPVEHNFYIIYYASDADYSTGTLSEQHIPASASTDELDYLTGDFFDSLRNLSPVLPWGFYKIGDGSAEFDIDDAKSAYDGTKTSADFIYNRSYLEEEGYDTWNDAGAANDIYYGVLYEVRPYMYWINGYDEEDVPTIYYYATEESGGTAVVIGTNGVEYNGLESLVKQDIKKAVFVDNIVATDVRRYFAGFSGLESITGLGKLDTSNATSFEKMFDNCSTIEELDVSGLETDSLTDTSYMFNDCRNVTTITFGDNFDTSSVTNMKQMFSTCNALTTINFGNKFDTSNVTNMDSMFTAVGAETLDLAKFDTSKVTDMYGMFAESLELKTIKVSDKFVVDQVTEGDYMFVDCSKLVGGKGTIYDDTSSPWGKTYAHIDEGDANPGFFTAASTPKPTPTPTPTPNRGSTSGDSSSGGGGSSDPTHGPMGDLTKNPLYANALNNISVNTTNNIPQSSLINNNGLYVQLKSMQENANASYCNARDYYGNTGYGQWLRVPNTTTWYFYSGDLSQATNGQPQGFLSNGWFNLGWDGIDRWYHFDGSGVMQLGWYQEAGKTYFLQNDFNDNWYGKAVTGTQNIGGRVYNFDANGALIN